MVFIPNTADAGFADQAAPQSWDFDQLVLSYGMTGVQGAPASAGCAVTAQGTPNMTVAVAAGTVRIRGRKVTVAAGNVTITTAHATNPRIDLITADTSGTKAAVAGTAAATNPVIPATPTDRVALAAVYIPANDTAIGANQITDKRVFWLAPPVENIGWYGAVGDDATECQTAIDAAIAAVGTTTAGTIYYPSGIFRTSGGHIIYSRHHHLGAGRQNTVLRLTAGSNPLALFVGENFLTLADPDNNTAAGVQQFSITHMSLDGERDIGGHTAVLPTRPPAPGTSGLTTGGTLAAGAYSYRIVAKNALGQTMASDYAGATVASGTTGSVVLTWAAITGATNYRIYGRTYPGKFMIEVGAVMTWTDTGSVTPSTVSPPTHNWTATAGVKIYGYNYLIDDVVIKHFPGEGFFSRWYDGEWTGDTDIARWEFMEAFISRVKVFDNNADGFIYDGPHDSHVRDCLSFFNGPDFDWTINFDIRALGYSTQFTNCHGYGNARYAWRVVGTFQLTACTGEGAREAQLQIMGDELRVWGGEFFAAGTAFPSAVGISMGWSGYQPKNTLIWGTHVNGFQKPGAAIDFTYMGPNCRIFAMVNQDPPQTTLTALMTNVQTTASVTSGANLANGDSIVVDNERMLITAGGGTTTLTVTRAQGGTIAAAHSNAALVTRYDPAYLGTIDEGSDVDLFVTGTAQKITPSFRKFESNVGQRSTDFGFADTTLAFKNATNAPSVNPASGAQLFASGGSMWQRGINGAAPLGSGLSEILFWFSNTITTAVAEQGLNLPAALTELDVTPGGTRQVINCDDLGAQVAVAVNMRSVAHVGGTNTILVSIRDTANTANILATVTIAESGVGNYQAVSAWAAKPAWAVGTKTVAVYTSGGDGTDDMIFRSVSLRTRG